MAVFLAGGAGFIGSHMAVELLAQGYEIVVADNYSNSTPEALSRVRRLAGREFAVYDCDVRDAGRLDEIFGRHGIDCIIHFAGFKAAGESVDLPI